MFLAVRVPVKQELAFAPRAHRDLKKWIHAKILVWLTLLTSIAHYRLSLEKKKR